MSDLENINIGAPLFTPKSVLDEMQSVATEIDILKREIDTSNVDTNFKIAFNSLVIEWNNFFNANSKGIIGFARRTLNVTWDKTQEFKGRLSEWRKRFIDAGNKTYSTSLEPIKQKMGFTRMLMWGSITFAAIYLTWWLFKEPEHQKVKVIHYR